ncbi:MAG: CDP-alcohol phosphatidyltransferase family protein [Patescibacteria group bacterium]
MEATTPTQTTASANPVVPVRSVIKADDGFLAYYFSAQLANVLVRVLRHTPVTPNMLTFISLVLGVITAYFYSRGDWQSLIIGAILHHISFILDCGDGQLARVKGLKSQMGHWFDYHSDKIKDFLLLLGLAWGVYAQTGWAWILVIAFITIALQFLRNITELNRQLFTWNTSGKPAEKVAAIKPKSQFTTTIKNSLLFKLSDRTLLITLAALLNLASLGIIVYAVLALVFALGSGFLNYRTFNRYDHTHTGGAVQQDQNAS